MIFIKVWRPGGDSLPTFQFKNGIIRNSITPQVWSSSFSMALGIFAKVMAMLGPLHNNPFWKSLVSFYWKSSSLLSTPSFSQRFSLVYTGTQTLEYAENVTIIVWLCDKWTPSRYWSFEWSLPPFFVLLSSLIWQGSVFKWLHSGCMSAFWIISVWT